MGLWFAALMGGGGTWCRHNAPLVQHSETSGIKHCPWWALPAVVALCPVVACPRGRLFHKTTTTCSRGIHSPRVDVKKAYWFINGGVGASSIAR